MGPGKENKMQHAAEQNSKSEIKSSHPPTVIFAGFSRLPMSVSTPQTAGILSLELEIDPYDMRVVDASCNCLPSIGQKFLTSLLVGKTIADGVEDAIMQIRKRYFSIAQRAMIAALEDLLYRHQDFWQQHEKEKEMKTE